MSETASPTRIFTFDPRTAILTVNESTMQPLPLLLTLPLEIYNNIMSPFGVGTPPKLPDFKTISRLVRTCRHFKNHFGPFLSGYGLLVAHKHPNYLLQVTNFLNSGADVNFKDNYGIAMDKSNRRPAGIDFTALHYAAETGNVEVAKLLISKGADIFAIGPHSGHYPLHRAAIGGSIEMVKLFDDMGMDMDYGPIVTPLFYAVERKHYELTKQMLEWGAVPNYNPSGLAPVLHQVADFRMLRLLVEYGNGDVVGSVDASGRTLLDKIKNGDHRLVCGQSELRDIMAYLRIHRDGEYYNSEDVVDSDGDSDSSTEWE